MKKIALSLFFVITFSFESRSEAQSNLVIPIFTSDFLHLRVFEHENSLSLKTKRKRQNNHLSRSVVVRIDKEN